MATQSSLVHKRGPVLLAVVLIVIASIWFSVARSCGGPLILIFDVDGKLLLRERGVFRCEDYPIHYHEGGWYIQRPDEIAAQYMKAPLPKTTQIHAPYRTRTIDNWYYVLEHDGSILSCRSDDLDSKEIRYVDGDWCIQVDGEWMSVFDY